MSSNYSDEYLEKYLKLPKNTKFEILKILKFFSIAPANSVMVALESKGNPLL